MFAKNFVATLLQQRQ